ncbi:hypothetical protein XELAEV_18024939mg [Xenopus laevis]|uniref:Uncharacterized protein n=1 Tax=Xenopus laevis TaxID=8355 RepID=A0A974CYL1_XENLA|nr:hypothetical protein XELAEV_18024939mg [Xenopus laevis]
MISLQIITCTDRYPVMQPPCGLPKHLKLHKIIYKISLQRHNKSVQAGQTDINTSFAKSRYSIILSMSVRGALTLMNYCYYGNA